VAGHILHTRRETITFKGFRDGLHLILDEEALFPEIQEDLYNHLQKAGSFFAGAPVILQLGKRLLSLHEFQIVQQMLADHANITITQVACEREEVKAFFREHGFPLAAFPEQEERVKSVERRTTKKVTHNNTLLIKQTLRSGQRIVAEEHLVVVGDVNPGAELIAGGDVIVFGTLRGVAHAGMPDNTAAVIMALHLQPTQLRIANFIGRAPDWGEIPREVLPEMAKIMDDQIVIEAVNKKTEARLMTKERLQK
jgi:septum site-determining protein MinC